MKRVWYRFGYIIYDIAELLFEKGLNCYVTLVEKSPRFAQKPMVYTLVFPLWCVMKVIDKFEGTLDIDSWKDTKADLDEHLESDWRKNSKLSKALE